MSHTITLVCEGKLYPIPDAWIRRWSFLSDLMSEDVDGLECVPWTYTSAAILTLWMKINKQMDTARGKKLLTLLQSDRMPMSSVWSIVDFMGPVDDKWSLYTQIDEKIPEEMRKPFYSVLGRTIRASGKRHSYSTKPSGKVDYFFLWADPVYSVPDKYAFGKLPKDMRDSVLGLEDLNVLTGIVHTCQKSTIRWRDVATMVQNPYLLDPLYHTEESPIASYTSEERRWYIQRLIKPEAKNYLAHAMADLPIPIGRGPTPVYLDQEAVTPEVFSHLLTFMQTVPDCYLTHFTDACGLSDYISGFRLRGDGLSSLFGRLPYDFREAAEFIRTQYGVHGVTAYRSILERYKGLIHLTTRKTLERTEEFIRGLAEWNESLPIGTNGTQTRRYGLLRARRVD